MSLLARVNPQFVGIPGGEFKMGSTQRGDTQPVETRTMSAFKMMDAPTTIRQFQEYVEWGEQTGNRYGQLIYGSDGRIAQTIWGSSIKAVRKKIVSLEAGQSVGDIRQLVPTWQEYMRCFDNTRDGARRFLGDDKPAVTIGYYEAAGFCAAIGCELPTEAQYEYAARAGREGDDVYGTDSAKLTAENAHWNHDGSVNTTADVRSYPPNPWGLYDMAGNVLEWCSNCSSPDYEGWASKDPVGPLVGDARALRGGSWSLKEEHLLASYRNCYQPYLHYNDFGFRAVRTQR